MTMSESTRAVRKYMWLLGDVFRARRDRDDAREEELLADMDLLWRSMSDAELDEIRSISRSIVQKEMEIESRREWDKFIEALPELLKTIPNKYVVFADGEVKSIHEDFMSAYEVRCLEYKMDDPVICTKVEEQRPKYIPTLWLASRFKS